MNSEMIMYASFIVLVAVLSGMFVSRTKTASMTDDIIIVCIEYVLSVVWVRVVLDGAVLVFEDLLF